MQTPAGVSGTVGLSQKILQTARCFHSINLTTSKLWVGGSNPPGRASFSERGSNGGPKSGGTPIETPGLTLARHASAASPRGFRHSLRRIRRRRLRRGPHSGQVVCHGRRSPVLDIADGRLSNLAHSGDGGRLGCFTLNGLGSVEIHGIPMTTTSVIQTPKGVWHGSFQLNGCAMGQDGAAMSW